MAVLTLDYEKFHSGTEAERREFAQTLLDGFKRVGFVKLVNHGFSSEEIEDIYQWVRVHCFHVQYLQEKPRLTSYM
jgi:isopenicillin N synthase-like dioxygenase